MRIAILLLLLAGAPSFAASVNTSDRFGLGVIFGEPTGLVGKYWTSRTTAFDAGLAYSFGSFVLINADYLVHFPGAIRAKQEFFSQLAPYVGIGAVVFLSDGSRDGDRYFSRSSSFGIGARIPLGIEWLPPRAPLGVFLELVPGVGLAPSVFGFAQGGLGARFYF